MAWFKKMVKKLKYKYEYNKEMTKLIKEDQDKRHKKEMCYAQNKLKKIENDR